MKLWKFWDKFKLAMSVEVVVLLFTYIFLLLSFGWLKSNQCYETCKLAICYMDPSKSSNLTLKRGHGIILARRSWWNIRLLSQLGRKMLKLRRERRVATCMNCRWQIVTKFPIEMTRKKVGCGHYGTKCWVVDFLRAKINKDIQTWLSLLHTCNAWDKLLTSFGYAQRSSWYGQVHIFH
jgi:hypothetical protein